MRILLVILIWILMVGGLALYIRARGVPLPGATAPASQATAGHVTLEITPTFTAEPDPFALQTGTTEPPAALILRMNGRELSRITDKIESGKALRIEPKDAAVTGTNELFLEASPPSEQSEQSHALRVRVYRDGLLLADQTLWSEPGGKVLGSVSFAGQSTPTQEHHH